MSKYKIALGITAIAAVGVITGLLIAPQKGKKLRKKIKKISSGLMEDINNFLSREKNTEPLDQDFTHESMYGYEGSVRIE